MTLETFLSFGIGVAALTLGAELLIRGASRLAAAVGISPLVIGLTVVAYGTSTPELAVSAKAAWAGQSDLSLGNVVGSNIFNVLFILGACALILPLKVHAQLIRRDVPVMIGTSIALLPIAYDGQISRAEGMLLLVALGAYTVFIIRKSRGENRVEAAPLVVDAPLRDGLSLVAPLVNAIVLTVGLGLLVFGAELFVNASISLAKAFGVSELVIGLTVVAMGTSLPEVATSILATVRGQRDIAIGNVVGSNIFNILGVLGSSSVIKSVQVSNEALYLDIPIMIAVAVACFPIFFTGMTIRRWEGATLFASYIAYTIYLVLNSQSDYRAQPFGQIAAVVAGLIFVGVMIRAIRERNTKPAGST